MLLYLELEVPPEWLLGFAKAGNLTIRARQKQQSKPWHMKLVKHGSGDSAGVGVLERYSTFAGVHEELEDPLDSWIILWVPVLRANHLRLATGRRS
jgi:hypothetical protein